MQYSKLTPDLKDLVRHMMIVQMQTNDGLISSSDVHNILNAVSVLAEPVSGSVGEMKVDPAKPGSEETAVQYHDPKMSDDAIDALLFALFGAGLTQAAEDAVNQVEAKKPRWKVVATYEDIILWVNTDEPQEYIATGRGKKLSFELPVNGKLPPAEMVSEMLDMFGEDAE